MNENIERFLFFFFHSFLGFSLDFCTSFEGKIDWMARFSRRKEKKVVITAIRRFSRINYKVIGDDGSFRCKCKIDVCLSADKLAIMKRRESVRNSTRLNNLGGQRPRLREF